MTARLSTRLRYGLNLIHRVYSTEATLPIRRVHHDRVVHKVAHDPLVRELNERISVRVTRHDPDITTEPLPHLSPVIMPEESTQPQAQPNRHAADMLMLQKYLGLVSPDQVLSKGKIPANNKDPSTWSDIVFLSIDLEAFEYDQNKITEIGVSVLDTRNLAGITPGTHATSWLAKIKTRHLRISEYKKLVNKRFIKGCPDNFNFGDSEFVQLNQIRNILTQIFNNPAGVQAPTFDKRKIVLVGHGLSNDTNYLKALNFSPNASGNVVRSMDTQVLSGSTKRLTLGLERVLRGLGADPVNLHNAGNDAAYTLQALVMMAVQQTHHPDAYLDAIRDVVMPETFKQQVKRIGKAKRQAKLAAHSGKTGPVAQKPLPAAVQK